MKARYDMITVFVVRPDEGGQSHEILQLRRAADDYMGGTWQVVRGGMEPGETPVAAALRELREETGLVPREFYRLGSVESFYTETDDTLWHAIGFCAVVDRQQPVQLNHEHDAFRWIPRAQAADHLMWASERQALADLCHDILDNGPGKVFLQVKAPDR
jgi:dihydroneopterin triphosphate diphosphatase